MKRLVLLLGFLGGMIPFTLFSQCFCETAARKGGHFFVSAYFQPGFQTFQDQEMNPGRTAFVPGLKIGFTLNTALSLEFGAETVYYDNISRQAYYPLEDTRYLFLPMALVLQKQNAKDRFIPFVSFGINHQIRLNSRLYAPEGSSITNEETTKGYLNTQAQISGGLRMIISDHTSWNAGIIYRKSIGNGVPQDPNQFIGLQLAFNIHF
jgi:hypothetical protein